MLPGERGTTKAKCEGDHNATEPDASNAHWFHRLRVRAPLWPDHAGLRAGARCHAGSRLRQRGLHTNLGQPHDCWCTIDSTPTAVCRTVVSETVIAHAPDLM